MAKESEAFQRIFSVFEDFCVGVERCRRPESDSADIQDAHDRLYRLAERFGAEKNNLRKSEKEPLINVFEENHFTEGMLKARGVSAHVKSRKPFKYVALPELLPFTVSTESSALTFFAGRHAKILAIDGEIWHVDNLAQLEHQLELIKSAIAKARG